MLYQNKEKPRSFLSPSRKPLDKHLPYVVETITVGDLISKVREKWKLLEVSPILLNKKEKARPLPKEKKEKKPKKEKAPKKEKKPRIERVMKKETLKEFLDI